ncbi:DUF2179 domain-containing protein [Herbivorax sp. ANBcel31]|uniref:DUF2179 domain-containing protein n=1 Tax=Herbivorax sp. ANBcel31 TaxID=3069754 RepID=UPI0027AF9417|nr:DUF2179 domain-containing protein [Herbivorax sp. ANBcel31]MDQ2086405.1 DUF2179 domain-containing protein [Herbivorax sp. ANBcel31]
MFSELFSQDVYAWVVLPLLIFVSRILDVSIGTIRIIFVSRGKSLLAPLLGFFEVLIWIVVIGELMQNLDSVFSYVAYAGGFAMGTYIGMLIEEKLAIGMLLVRIIVMKDECHMKSRLCEAGFGVTVVDAQGKTGEVKIIYSIIKRKELEDVVDIIEKCNSKAFYSIEDARKVNQGVFRSGGAMSYSKRNKFGISKFYRRFGRKSK